MPYIIKTSKRNQNEKSEAQLYREFSMARWGVPNAKCAATKKNGELCGRVARHSNNDANSPRCNTH